MLDVIGAGFGRTGTLTLKSALERLGFGPCEHMKVILGDHERTALWRRAVAGGPMDWDAFFAGYRASVDFPGACFWRELADHFQRARVILTVRDPEDWYASTRNTIYAIDSLPPSPALADGRALAQEAIWDGVFGGRFEDRDHAIEVFNEHNAEVRRTIAPDRLLEFDVAEGWPPLCAFLDVPVPDVPFPHHNTRADFIELMKEHPNYTPNP